MNTPSRAAKPTDVVFDLGGVMFHWSPAALVATHLPGLAPDAPSAEALADRFFGGFGGDWAEFDRGRLGREAIVDSVAARTGFAASTVAAVVDGVPVALRPDAATEVLLIELQGAGLRAWYLSNMPRPYAEHLVPREPVFTRFAGGIFSCDVGWVKPEPEIFQLTVDRLGLDPAHTVLLDDNAANVRAAQALGWQAVRYTSAEQARAALLGLGLLI